MKKISNFPLNGKVSTFSMRQMLHYTRIFQFAKENCPFQKPYTANHAYTTTTALFEMSENLQACDINLQTANS